VIRTVVPALAGVALLVPLGDDVRFNPVLAWVLAALNLIVILGAVAMFAASRRRRGQGTVVSEPSPRSVRPQRTAPPVPARPPARPRRPADPRTPSPEDRQILARLADPDPFLRMSAIAAMRGRVECEAALVRALSDRYPMVRREVVRALRSTGSSYATETLIKVAAHDPSAEVREEAVAALGALLREQKPGEPR
jgi:hypothetical protein